MYVRTQNKDGGPVETVTTTAHDGLCVAATQCDGSADGVVELSNSRGARSAESTR